MDLELLAHFLKGCTGWVRSHKFIDLSRSSRLWISLVVRVMGFSGSRGGQLEYPADSIPLVSVV